MPTYAESKSATEEYGFPIFYELLSLDDALAGEAAANEGERDTFGNGFDAYLTRQLDLIRMIYADGFVSGTAFSTRAPEGEYSSAIPGVDLTPLSREQYESARASGWLVGVGAL